jgi:hypothetical protein
MEDLELFTDLLANEEPELDDEAPEQEADTIEEKIITENI